MKKRVKIWRAVLIVLGYGIIGALIAWHFDSLNPSDELYRSLGIVLAATILPLSLAFFPYVDEKQSRSLRNDERYGTVFAGSCLMAATVFGLQQHLPDKHDILNWIGLTALCHPIFVMVLDMMRDRRFSKLADLIGTTLAVFALGSAGLAVAGLISIPFDTYPSLIVTAVIAAGFLFLIILDAKECGEVHAWRSIYLPAVYISETLATGLLGWLFLLTGFGFLLGLLYGFLVALCYETTYRLADKKKQPAW